VEVTFVPLIQVRRSNSHLGGHITGAVEELAETLPLIEAGKLKSLCVIMDKRHPALPNVPCSKEIGIDYTHGLMRAWAVKKGTPPERQKFLLDVITKSLDHPMYVKFVKDNHLDARPGYLGPEETRKYWEQQVEFSLASSRNWGTSNNPGKTDAAEPYISLACGARCRPHVEKWAVIMNRGNRILRSVCRLFGFMLFETLNLLGKAGRESAAALAFHGIDGFIGAQPVDAGREHQEIQGGRPGGAPERRRKPSPKRDASVPSSPSAS
jgi:hypothetical protein